MYANDFHTPETAATGEKLALKNVLSLLGLSLILFRLLAVAVPGLVSFGLHFVSQVWGFSLREYQTQLLNALCTVLIFFLPFFLYVLLLKIPIRIVSPIRKTSGRLVLLGTGAALGISGVDFFLSMILNLIFYLFGFSVAAPPYYEPSGTVGILTAVVTMCIVPAVLEELTFRGVVMQSLRRFGDGFALVVSAFLFALMHYSPLQFANAFLMGLVIGFFVLKSNSLVTGMVMHFTNNLLVTLMGYFLRRQSDFAAGLIQFAYFIAVLLLGLLAYLYIRRKDKQFFTLRKNTSSLNNDALTLIVVRNIAFVAAVVLIVCNMMLSLSRV